jgi:hypothetical protein
MRRKVSGCTLGPVEGPADLRLLFVGAARDVTKINIDSSTIEIKNYREKMQVSWPPIPALLCEPRIAL